MCRRGGRQRDHHAQVIVIALAICSARDDSVTPFLKSNTIGKKNFSSDTRRHTIHCDGRGGVTDESRNRNWAHPHHGSVSWTADNKTWQRRWRSRLNSDGNGIRQTQGHAIRHH